MRALIRFDCFGVIFMIMIFTSFVRFLEFNYSVVFSESRFSVPAPESHRSVASLRRHKLCFAHSRAMHEKFAHAVAPPLPKKSYDFSGTPTVVAKSYLIRIVIQFSRYNEKVFHLFPLGSGK